MMGDDGRFRQRRASRFLPIYLLHLRLLTFCRDAFQENLRAERAARLNPIRNLAKYSLLSMRFLLK